MPNCVVRVVRMDGRDRQTRSRREEKEYLEDFQVAALQLAEDGRHFVDCGCLLDIDRMMFARNLMVQTRQTQVTAISSGVPRHLGPGLLQLRKCLSAIMMV